MIVETYDPYLGSPLRIDARLARWLRRIAAREKRTVEEVIESCVDHCADGKHYSDARTLR